MLTAIDCRLVDYLLQSWVITLFFSCNHRFRFNTKHAAKFGFQIKSSTTHCQLKLRYKTCQTYLLTVETCHILTSQQRLGRVMNAQFTAAHCTVCVLHGWPQDYHIKNNTFEERIVDLFKDSLRNRCCGSENFNKRFCSFIVNINHLIQNNCSPCYLRMYSF